jgi:predicted glutamine amidotransferase
MCGLAGFSGIRDARARFDLVWALGFGIDDRGGHAAGFVTLDNGRVIEGRKLGHWSTAKDKFIRRAAIGETTLMHARWATCGDGTINEAHPFKIMRNGAPVLYGAHNGIIWDAEISAHLNDRDYSVDSKELFELLADDADDQIRDLTGYGVITWVEAANPDAVLLSKLSSSGEIYVCSVRGGGIVWGSTAIIVRDALKEADLEEKTYYLLEEVGRVYRITPERVTLTSREGVRVGAGYYGSSLNQSRLYSLDDEDKFDEDRLAVFESDWMAQYMASYNADREAK